MADEHNLRAFLDALIGNELLELLLGAALLREQTIDIDRTRSIDEVEVTILVVILQVGDSTRELIPHSGALLGCVEISHADFFHFVDSRFGNVSTLNADEVGIQNFNLILIGTTVADDGNG